MDFIVRQNYFFKAVFALIFLILIVGLTGCNNNSKEIIADTVTAKEFIIRDDNGRKMALLTSNENGANFTLYDNDGNTRMKMVVDKDYSSVELIDANRRTTLALKEQGSALTFYDSNDTIKALLGMIGENYTIISFYDDNEQPMMVLDTDGHKSSMSWPLTENPSYR